uniref:FERM domain-containing protein n=1 Tax=Rhabditophanes sp. KR3021 TaxID=114890 RepID=A0AC35TY96_9BILA
MTEFGRKAEYSLPNGIKFELIITKSFKVSELFEIGALQCNLDDKKDHRYFGVALILDNGHYHWLAECSYVVQCEHLKIDFGNEFDIGSIEPIQLQFSIKYFVTNCLTLTSPAAVNIFFFEAKAQMLKGQLDLYHEDYIKLYALLLQILEGDFVSDKLFTVLFNSVYVPKNVLKKCNRLLSEMRSEIGLEYKKLQGEKKGFSMVQFVKIAETAVNYGSRYYQVKDVKNKSLFLAVNQTSIIQYCESDLIKAEKVFSYQNSINFLHYEHRFSVEIEAKYASHQNQSPLAKENSLNKLQSSSMSIGSTSSSADSQSILEYRKVSVMSLNGPKNKERMKGEVEQAKVLRKQLVEKKEVLGEELIALLAQLKDVCVEEAETTGKLPMDIYKTLAPGEPLPKFKMKIGTSFALSSDVLANVDKVCLFEDDSYNQLEVQINVQRKIVDAANKLASDKTTNKSVRKKRKRDFEAAHTKLKGLEMRVMQMRIAQSKPDLTSGQVSENADGQTWTKYGGKGFVTKSCPTTPRGSFSDISMDSTHNTRSNKFNPDNNRFMKSLFNIAEKTKEQYQNFATQYTSFRVGKPIGKEQFSSSIGRLNSMPAAVCQPTRRAHSIVTTQRNPLKSTQFSYEDSKIEDVCKSSFELSNGSIQGDFGYHTSAPYISSYRQSRYPTLFDQQSAKSNGQSRSSSVTLNSYPSPTPHQGNHSSVAVAASNQMGLIVQQINNSQLLKGPFYSSTTSFNNRTTDPAKTSTSSFTGLPFKSNQFNRIPMKESNSSPAINATSDLFQSHRKITTFPAANGNVIDRPGGYKIAPERSSFKAPFLRSCEGTATSLEQAKSNDWYTNMLAEQLTSQERVEKLVRRYGGGGETIQIGTSPDRALNKSSTATIV